jgi:hypothetical protein
MTAGIAAVQARITELRALVAPATVGATDPTSTVSGSTAAGLSTSSTASASSFASALAAMGIDAVGADLTDRSVGHDRLGRVRGGHRDRAGARRGR